MFPCFKKKPPRVEIPRLPVIVPPVGVFVPTSKIKVAIIVGHNKKKQGATNYLDESEWVFNSRIARKLQGKLAALGIDSVIIFRPYDVGYDDQCEAVADEAARLGCTHAISLHFNDASSRSAMGVEVLIAKTATEADNKFADIFSDILNEEYGFVERRDDGVYTISDRHNGSGMINAVNDKGIITCLVEVCFGGHKTKESELIFEQEDKYVDVLVKSVRISWLGATV